MTPKKQQEPTSGLFTLRRVPALLALCLSLVVAPIGAFAQSASKPQAKAQAKPQAKNAAQSKSSSMVRKNVARPTAASAQKKNIVKASVAAGSTGSRLGLRSEFADLALNSSAVLVMEQGSGSILLEKNASTALPIASITKVMTAMVTLEANLPLDEVIVIAKEDSQLEKYSGSRLKVGSAFTRAELLHLALMSSENRAAQALGRTYPGGLEAFVAAMNEKARALGMSSSHFVEPTGLSSANVASPKDLARMVSAAHGFPLIREYSTDRDAIVRVGGREQQFRNTNALTRNESWEIGLSKTGFIRDAGRCLVMQANIDDRDVIIVMLDAEGSAKRLADAERIRRWLAAERDRQVLSVRS
ncbi:MAG: peptidase S11 [Burkholderiaceae bacterium]|nr:peptidase S11 [Burkholderiaceae bacterium]